MNKIGRYKKDSDYSYCLGPFPSMELIEKRPDLVRLVYISEDFNEKDSLVEKLDYLNIPYDFSEKSLNRLADKNREYVIAVFKKEESYLKSGSHVILDGVDNMGNLGTIMRSMLAFGYNDLALIGSTCDHYNPKVIRASMGAFFRLRVQKFKSLADYQRVFTENKIYSFLLNDRARGLSQTNFEEPYSLAFGNEGAGLSKDFFVQRAVYIEQSSEVDSLNLPMAATIALYKTRRNK
ncbi:MAG: RNA methyltransferase [Finegoldia sp.]|nr:RNA methyltransferase [Finegoldia sp.]